MIAAFSEFVNHLLVTADPLLQWLTQYGQYALVILLALGVVGLPIPDETLMAIAGIYIAKGDWAAIPTIIAVLLGTFSGITLSYIIGCTAGIFLVKRYGYWLGLTEVRIEKAHQWFEHIGKWALVIGYFIPGVRHLTGYIAGTLKLGFKEFAFFAYTGALLWSAVFLSFGYFFQMKVL